MKWVREEPQVRPVERSVLRHGTAATIAVNTASADTADPRQWQYFDLSFGIFSEESHAQCLETWPLASIRMARDKLEQLEAELQKGLDDD